MKRTSLQWISGAKTPAKTYITRVFNFGTFEEWKKMKNDFKSGQIKDAIERPLKGQWTRHGKALAELLSGGRMPKEALISYEV